MLRDDDDRPLTEDEWPDAEDRGDDVEVPCPHCGRSIHEDTQRCPGCGNWLFGDDLMPPSPRHRWPIWLMILLTLLACAGVGAFVLRLWLWL